MIFRRPFAGMLICCLLTLAASAWADSATAPCASTDRACLHRELDSTISGIEDKTWRDQSLRELAKSLAGDGEFEAALALLPRIETPDTRALTIRGIGMAAAKRGVSGADLTLLFSKLRKAADTIDHPPSFAIALTYIGMAQSFAGLDEAATATAMEMTNPALRNKALGEIAEIQAERGDPAVTLATLEHIDSVSFRNKALMTVSGVLCSHGHAEGALMLARRITNPTERAQALQFVLDHGITAPAAQPTEGSP